MTQNCNHSCNMTHFNCGPFRLWFVAYFDFFSFQLWPISTVAHFNCSPYRLWPISTVAHFDCGPFQLWPISTVAHLDYGPFRLWPPFLLLPRTPPCHGWVGGPCIVAGEILASSGTCDPNNRVCVIYNIYIYIYI